MSAASWIADGEKYAVVGLSVKLEGKILSGNVTPHLWVVPDIAFDIPKHWREWLGTVRTEELEDSNLFLLSKIPSSTPGVLDAENPQLLQRV